MPDILFFATESELINLIDNFCKNRPLQFVLCSGENEVYTDDVNVNNSLQSALNEAKQLSITKPHIFEYTSDEPLSIRLLDECAKFEIVRNKYSQKLLNPELSDLCLVVPDDMPNMLLTMPGIDETNQTFWSGCFSFQSLTSGRQTELFWQVVDALTAAWQHPFINFYSPQSYIYQNNGYHFDFSSQTQMDCWDYTQPVFVESLNREIPVKPATGMLTLEQSWD